MEGPSCIMIHTSMPYVTSRSIETLLGSGTDETYPYPRHPYKIIHFVRGRGTGSITV